MAANDPPTLRKALAFYEQAVALDPSFAQGWARVSGCGLAAVPQRRSRTGVRRARPPGRREGDRRWLRPAGGLSGPRKLPAPRQPGLRRGPGDLRRRDCASLRTTSPSSRPRPRPSFPPATWDASLEHARQAERLDPRSPASAMRSASTLRALRRYREVARKRTGSGSRHFDLHAANEPEGDEVSRGGGPRRRAGHPSIRGRNVDPGPRRVRVELPGPRSGFSTRSNSNCSCA